MTGVLDKSGGGTGITRRMGLFDDNNGLFLEDAEGTYRFVRRTSVTGSPVDNGVAQSSWNVDKMDGTGQSGITIDFSKAQILVIDFEWLGTGRARVGFNVDGVTHYAHEFLNANNLSQVYMSTPNLPFRYEIDNDGNGAASTLEHICVSLISEGGIEELGILRHADSGSIGTLATGSTYALLGLRLNSNKLDGIVKLESLSVLSASVNDKAHWELKWKPTVASVFTYASILNGVVDVASGASGNTVTGGYDMDGGYFTTALPVGSTTPNALRIGSAIDGTADEVILTCTPITNNITVEASMTWRELT